MSFLFDLFQQFQIDENTRKQGELTANQSASHIRETELQAHLDRLTLVCAALWEMIKKSQNLRDKDLEDLVKDIDLRDGKLDGKMTLSRHCENCHRIVAARHKACLYCGGHAKKRIF